MPGREVRAEAPPRWCTRRRLVAALCACWAALTLGWLASIYTDLRCARFRGCGPCPGPQRAPAPRREPWCHKFAAVLAAEVAAEDAKKGVEVAFYGDSITETWRESDMGRPCARCRGVGAVFQEHFGRYRTAVLAVGGDQAAHLLWRLQHGDLYRQHPPRAAVLMIGTNDLGAASCGGEGRVRAAANGTFTRVAQVVRLLRRKTPATRILILAILPRGGVTPATGFSWPNLYTHAIQDINDRLRGLAEADAQAAFLDCGPALTPGGVLHPDLMPDALHPNAAGMGLLASCIDPVLQSLVGPGGAGKKGSKGATGAGNNWIRRRLWPNGKGEEGGFG